MGVCNDNNDSISDRYQGGVKSSKACHEKKCNKKVTDVLFGALTNCRRLLPDFAFCVGSSIVMDNSVIPLADGA